MKVAILNDYQRAVPTLAAYARLSGHDVEAFADAEADEVRLAGRLAGFDAVILIRERTRVTRTLLARLPALKLLVQTGKVGPHVDVAACQERGVTVCDGTGSPVAPAELAWALMLAASRQLVDESNRLRAGRWQGHLGTTLAGRTLGLFGFGKIAQIMARYAEAFDMRVAVWGRETTLARARAAGIETFRTCEYMFADADIVSLHLRLNAETRGIVTPSLLARMKPDAMIVNTSRAELIETGALEVALKAGRPGFAALDVFDHEPVLDTGDPLLQLSNVIATPHIGFVERNTYEKYLGDAIDAVNAFAAGAPVRVVQAA